MGLFVRRTETGTHAPLYSMGFEKTILIVGLGNPGKKYDLTRHNIGFACLDAFAEAENGQWAEKKPFQSLLCDLRLGQNRVLLCKPQTYMNESGQAVQALQAYFKVGNAETVVVHDELDIKFGQIRARVGGSAAGHNGIKSVIQHCGEEFERLRIGVGPKVPEQIDSADFVLQKFSKEEQAKLKALTSEVISMLNDRIFGGPLTPDTRKFI